MNYFKRWTVGFLLIALVPAAEAAITITGNPNFGEQIINRPITRTFTLTNPDATPWINGSLLTIIPGGVGIIRGNGCDFVTLAPAGGTCSVDVTYTLSTLGPKLGSITYFATAPDARNPVLNFTGIGIAPVIPTLNAWALLFLAFVLGLIGMHKSRRLFS